MGKSVSNATSNSYFTTASVVQSGNTYAAGSIQMNNSFNFGDGVVSGTCLFSSNILLIKYCLSGAVQWAKTVAPAF